MAKKQVVVPGGIRKVIDTGGSSAAPGTTIAELGSTTVSLAQLKVLLGITTPAAGSSGGSSAPASLIPGAGLLGGGSILGAVPLFLRYSTPPVIWNDALLPDDFVGGAASGGGGAGGSSTLAGLSDVAISAPTASQVLAYNGTKWQNQAPPSSGLNPGGPTLVQQTYFRWQGPPSSAGTTALALPNAPTPGNVMVIISAGYDTSSSTFLTIPSGWTQLAYYNVNNTEGVKIAFRVAQTGDSASYTVGGGNGGNVFAIYEFSNVFSLSSIQTAISGSGSLVGVANPEIQPNSYNIGVLTTDAISAYASMTGATLLFDGTSAGTGTNNHPGVFYKPTLMTNVAITFTGANLLFPMGAALSVAGPPGLPAIQVAPGNISADLHPSNPDPINDEFEGVTLDPKWTLVNGTGATTSLSQGSLLFAGNNGSVDHPACLTQAISATSFTITAKLNTAGGTSSSGRAGIYVGLGGSNKLLVMGYYAPGAEIYVSRYTNPNTFSANPRLNGVTPYIPQIGAFLYLQCNYDGTNLNFNLSATGVPGSFVNVYSETAATFLGSAPTAVGLFNDNASPTNGQGVFDWFRRVDTSGTSVIVVAPSNITPDTHPSPPTAWDDEFEAGSTMDVGGSRFVGANAWTLINNGGATTVVSALLYGSVATLTTNGSANSGAFYSQAVPGSTPWEFTWKCIADGAFGFAIYNNSTWKGYYWGFNGGNLQLQSETRNASNNTYTFNATTATASWPAHTPVYFRVKNDGTNLIFSYSANGVNYTQLSSQTLASWVSSVTNIALIGNGGTNQVNPCAVDWFRRTA